MLGVDPFIGFKEKGMLDFGENSNDRLDYLRLTGSGPDVKIVVTSDAVIPDLMKLQPDDVPERYRWKRYQFVTVDEIQNDLKLQPNLAIKPQVKLILFDVRSINKLIEDRHLSRWMDMLLDRSGSILTFIY